MTLLRYGLLLKEGNYDIDLDEINEDKKLLTVNGKSSVYVKNVIIPELRAKATYWYNRYRFLKKNNTNILEYKKEVRKRASSKIYKAKKKNFSKLHQKLSVKAASHYYDKVKATLLEQSNFLHGAMAYPLINNFLAQRKELNAIEFQVLLIAYSHKWIGIDDGEVFGFERKKFSLYLNRLKRKGFIERFTIRLSKGTYVTTPKAKDFLNDYIKSQRKIMVELFKRLDEDFRPDGEYNFAYYNKKYISKIDLYEETDIKGLDKRTS